MQALRREPYNKLAGPGFVGLRYISLWRVMSDLYVFSAHKISLNQVEMVPFTLRGAALEVARITPLLTIPIQF